MKQRSATEQTENKARMTFNMLKTAQQIILAGVISATLFTLWTPNNIFSNQLFRDTILSIEMNQQQQFLPSPTPLPQKRIGIVAGHWGNDAGAVCPDGLTELDVNLRIATLVKQYLIEEGFTVDLLQEFDPRLSQYTAMALISIHNDSCDYINEEATGFKVAGALSNSYPEKSNRLTSCMAHRYNETTGLKFHYNTITNDMTGYHAFGEMNPDTTAIIIETGFMNLDRDLLTENPELVAKGIVNGILCYVRNEPIPDMSTISE
ncbi:MAG: N-acetylmuramoyl-L-alanine amidase [Anaerolineaceae bacterium]|nr:N-acetylmuramoyl-L-alanine amidase [Anaerolineaceae bacterium]